MARVLIQNVTKKFDDVIAVKNVELEIKDKEFLYSDISPGMFKEFKKNKELLTRDEIDVLQKIAQLKRAKEPGWGV